MSKKIEEIIIQFESIIQKEFPELIREDIEKESLKIRFIKQLIQLSNIYNDSDEKYQKKIQFIEDLIIIIYGDYEKYILNGGDTIIISDSKELMKNFLNYHIEKNQYTLVFKILENLISIYLKIILEDKIDFEYYNSIYNLKEFIINNKWNKNQEIIKLCLIKLDEKFKIGNLTFIKYFLIGLNPLNKEIFYNFVVDNYLNLKYNETLLNINTFDTISFYSYLIKIIEDLNNNIEINTSNKENEKIQYLKKYIEEKNEKKKNNIINKTKINKNKKFQLFVEIPKFINIKNIDDDIIYLCEKFFGGEIKENNLIIEELKIKKPYFCKKFIEGKTYFYGKICQILLKGLFGKLNKNEIINIISKEIEKIEIPELFLYKEIIKFLFNDKCKETQLLLLFFNENQYKYLKGIIINKLNQQIQNNKINNVLKKNEILNWKILIKLIILSENLKRLKKGKNNEKEEKINNIINLINQESEMSKNFYNPIKQYIKYLFYYLINDLNENNKKFNHEQLINLIKKKISTNSSKSNQLKFLLNFSYIKDEFIFKNLNNFYISKYNKNLKEFFISQGLITLIKSILSLENISKRNIYDNFIKSIFKYHQESKDKIIFFECLIYLENNFLNQKEFLPFSLEHFYMIFGNKHYSEIMNKVSLIIMGKYKTIPSLKVDLNLLNCKWYFKKKKISKKKFVDTLFYFLTDINKILYERNFDKIVELKEDIIQTFNNFEIINKENNTLNINIIEFSFEIFDKKKKKNKKQNLNEKNEKVTLLVHKNINENNNLNDNYDKYKFYFLNDTFHNLIFKIEGKIKNYYYHENIKKYFKKRNHNKNNENNIKTLNIKKESDKNNS